MPEYIFEPLPTNGLSYEAYMHRTGTLLAKYALEGRHTRFYYGATDDLTVLEGQMRNIITTRGSDCTFMTRPSCTIASTDRYFQASINIFYPDETHTISFMAPVFLKPKKVMLEIDAITARMEILKRELF